MKKFLSLVLALVMTMSLVTISAGAKDFTDGDDIQYTEAVDVISAIEVVDGYTDGSFNPDATLTRGAAAKIICNLLLGPTTASALSADAAPFSDVPTTNTFAGYIAYCSQQGIISGYADGTFRPAGTLTSYAFMKMLLGALGYDAEREGYVGPNWSVQVAKTALGIELDKGLVDDFNGLKAVTREEACLYAFNTLSANMVRYGETTNVIIGDAQVSVTGERRWDDDVTSTDGNIDGKTNGAGVVVGDGIVQFAERYFSKLVLRGDVDTFARPANTWTYKNDKVGTYAKTPDAVYTKSTPEADIYSDIGMTSNDEFYVYVDGISADQYDAVKYNNFDIHGNVVVDVRKGQEDNKIGEGNGAIINVYKEERVISIVNTYVGEVVAVEEATSKRDAYIELGTVGNIADAYKHDVLVDDYKFDTENFEVGDIVTFNYSLADDDVKNVKAAESVSGSVESFTTDKKFSMDGTTYEYGAKKTNVYGSADIGTDSTVYMDENGYVLYTKEGEENLKNYALVLNAGTESALAGDNYQAYLLFTDGTTKVVDTDKDYSNGNTTGDAAFGNGTNSLVGYWVTYKTNSKGETVLTRPGDLADHHNSDTASKVLTKNGETGVDLNGDGIADVKVNSATIIIVKDGDDFKVYEGVKNIPTITAKTNAANVVEYSTFGTSGFQKLVYMEVNANADIDNGTNKTIFLVADKDATVIETSSDKYYVFDAVVDGVKVDDGVMLDATDTATLGVIAELKYNKTSVLLDSYAEDNGFYTVDMTDKVVAGPNVDGDTLTSGKIEKVSGTCIDFDGEAYYTADDCVFYRVDIYGNLKKSSISGVRTADVGTGKYYAQISYVYNSDAELTGVYWVEGK